MVRQTGGVVLCKGRINSGGRMRERGDNEGWFGMAMDDELIDDGRAALSVNDR